MSGAPHKEALSRLVALLGLMRRARVTSDPSAFAFLAVNETHLLTPYRQATLWRMYRDPASGGHIEAVSGLAIPDHNAPYILWLSRVLERVSHMTVAVLSETVASEKRVEEGWVGESLAFSREQAGRWLPDSLREEWDSWLPRYGLWLPLTLFRDRRTDAPPLFLGGLFLTREMPWSREERQLLEELAGTYALVWHHVHGHRGWLSRFGDLFQGSFRFSRRMVTWGGVLLALLLLAMPVRQSVLAPAVVTAANPVWVRAPLAGVVDRFYVAPNEMVQKNQPLWRLEDTEWRNQFETAQKEREVAAAEYRQAVQKATRDPRSTTHSIIQKKRLEQKEADVAFLQDRLQRVEVRAARQGIAVFSDVNDWIGRPVALGERVLTLADPEQVALEIHLPVADAINLEVGADVVLFLTTHPGAPLPAVLEYASYQAEVTAEGLLAYRIRARFTELDRIPRIGLAGFARIYHETITLFHFVTRRPMAVLRRWLGW